MRNSDVYLGSLTWIAIATLMPLAALEPPPPPMPTVDLAACAAAVPACAGARS
jgi:hypothetical protein